MEIIRFCCIGAGLLFGNADSLAQQEAYLRQEIQKIITFDAQIDFTQTPGLLAGVVWKDSSYVFSYGVASKEDSTVLTGSSVFEIGELTQVFTAALALKMASQGLLDPDGKLAGMMGSETEDPYAGAISLRQCLNHTSGIPRYPPLFGEKEYSSEDPFAAYSKEDLSAFLKSFRPGTEPPLPYGFSNLNYGLVELALEKVSGRNFESLLEKELLQPLGLGHTRICLPAGDTSLITRGYNQAGKPAPHWNPASLQGALGAKSNMSDLLRFMQHLLAPQAAWEPVFSELYSDPVPTGIRKNTWMGYGWHLIYPKKNIRVVVHTGSTGGHMAYMAFVPETRTGVVVLANSPYGVRGLGMLVLRMLNNNWK